MLDLVMITAVLAFFGATWAYVRFAATVVGRIDPPVPPEKARP